MKKIIVSVINDLNTDQRVNKVCTSLTLMGFNVLLVGRKLPWSTETEKRSYSMHRMRLLFVKGPLFYAEYNFRLFLFLLFRKADLLVSNDLDTLLPNFIISRLKNIPLVYDSHEYFTETPEVINRRFVKKTWEFIEKMIFPKLKDVFTVNESIAKIFEKKYNVHVNVLRNIPPTFKPSVIKGKTELGLPENKNIIILQGAGINIHRGAEELIESLLYLDHILLLIIGSGDVIELLKRQAKSLNLETKVRFIPKIPYNELYNYTVHAEIGFSLDKGTNPNYRLSLPNKLFDYIHAGTPVLVSQMVEIKRIVTQYQVGEFIESHEPRHIADKIRNMLENPEKLAFYRRNCISAAKELCWENEEKILKSVYEKYI